MATRPHDGPTAGTFGPLRPLAASVPTLTDGSLAYRIAVGIKEALGK